MLLGTSVGRDCLYSTHRLLWSFNSFTTRFHSSSTIFKGRSLFFPYLLFINSHLLATGPYSISVHYFFVVPTRAPRSLYRSHAKMLSFHASVSLSLFIVANAHMVMDTPLPYNFGEGRLTNGPISSAVASTAQFPCQKTSSNVITASSATNATAWNGGSQLLHMTGSVVHGGGNCSVAITYAAPGSSDFDDPTQWKKIYDIPDCPTIGVAGNLAEGGTGPAGYPDAPNNHCAEPDSTETGCIRAFNVPMHAAMQNGAATFAWIWDAKTTGETYMNCAPVTVSGAQNNGQWASLPDLKQSMSIFGGNNEEAVPDQPAAGSGSAPAANASSAASSASAAPLVASATPVASSLSSAPQVATESAAASNTAIAPVASSSPASPVTTGVSGCETCVTAGATQCTSSSWQMCSDGCWVDMGGLGGFTCENGVMSKRSLVERRWWA